MDQVLRQRGVLGWLRWSGSPSWRRWGRCWPCGMSRFREMKREREAAQAWGGRWCEKCPALGLRTPEFKVYLPIDK